MLMRRGLGWVLVLLLGFTAPAGAQHAVDEGEAMLWVQRLQTIIYNGQMNSRLFSDRWFVREAIADFELDPDQSREFYDYSLGETLVPILTRAVGDDGSYVFLRFIEHDGHTLALFRLITDEKGANYHAWYLRADRAGRVTGWDVEVYLMGERFSQAMRRAWFPQLEAADPDFDDHVGRLDRLYTEHFDAIDALDDAHDTGRHQQVVAMYESLPADLQDHHVPMRSAIEAYGGLDRAEPCAALIERYRELYPDAANVELAFFYIEAGIGEFDEALAMIDAFDERLGGDVYLNFCRASIANQQGDYAQAQAYLDAGLALDLAFVDDPGRLKLVWRSVEYALAAEDWPRVSAMLTEVEMYEIVISDLNDFDLYAGYIESGAYEQWLAGRKPGEAWGLRGPWRLEKPEGPEEPGELETPQEPGGEIEE